jgi:exopolysaccharide biosynthesis polyprenyl glycosylphosphotransferase
VPPHSTQPPETPDIRDPRGAQIESAVPDAASAEKRGGPCASGSSRPVAPRSGAQGAQAISEQAVGEEVAPGLGSVRSGRSRTSGPLLSLDAGAWNRLRLLIDLATLYAATAAALIADGRFYRGGDLVIAAIYPLVNLVVLRARGWASERLKTTFLDTISSVVAGVALSTMLVIAAAAIFDVSRPLTLSVRLWLYASVYLSIARCMLLVVRRRAISSDLYATPTLILGAGVIGIHLARRLMSDSSYGLRPVGLLDPDPLAKADQLEAAPVPVLEGLDRLPDAVRVTGARHVILAFSSEPDHVLAPRVRECQALGVEVSLIPRMYESINERTTLDHVGGLPLLTLHTVDPYGWQFAVKHAFDRTASAIGLLLASPLLLTLAVLIKLSSPGPILFRQRRVGRDGHEFDLLKFRSMREAPAEVAQTTFVLTAGHAPGGVEGFDRRTWIGRIIRDLSLDELPQLVNVLRGDMSLVGPRPERPEYVARFTQEVVGYENRHRVRSGITGWAQVHGLRGQTSIADRVEWDNYYILNWSLRLDFRILALTVAEILRFRETD